MPKVRFLVTRSPKDGSGVVYEAGEVYTMSDASCRHWEVRGAAERVADRAKAADPQQFSPTGEPVPDETLAAEAAAKAQAEADAKAKEDARVAADKGKAKK